MAFNVKTFYTRATTAVVFVALLLGCVWYSKYSFIAFFTIVGFIGLYEFYSISEKLNTKPNRFIGFLLHLITMGNVFLLYGTIVSFNIGIFVILCFSLFIIELFKKEPSLSNVSGTIVDWVFVTLPCYLIIKIGYIILDIGFEPQRILGIIFFIWINDTGAYLVGSFIGKHKLYEKISPNKTWEGTLGGIALCIALSFVVANIFPQLALKHWVVISVIVAVFGTLGDLVESMLKRMAGVKDSGKLMPGHGGVLDRFDSLFFATPFVFCYLALMGLL